ncbi:MAG: glutaminyl-peptide cyclotransferase [Deinococcales bacterium]|nr:glutaminyl-peptide cyclotransferase [Chitinophagaceae bacterium]
MKKILLPFLIIVILNSCKDDAASTTEQGAMVVNNEPAIMSYTVTNVYPHDTTAFTEGLEWHDGALYESTGILNKSKLAKVNLTTGKDIQKISFPEFGEGITILNGKIYQLTYTEKKCFVYDAITLKKLQEFTYDGEGWGMTNNGKQLIMNNGGDKLYYRDPETFKVMNIVSVTDNYGPVAKINELEWVNGIIYSNIWETNTIITINPESGKVIGKVDMTNLIAQYLPELVEKAQIQGAYLNGIAYDSTGKRFFITGKLWPKMFEVKF